MKIDFTIEQISVLDKAIQQLPYYVASPLISHINQQIEEQRKIMDVPVPMSTENLSQSSSADDDQ